MKRSRILLAVALVLGISGAVAAKSKTFDLTVYYQETGSTCPSTTIPNQPSCNSSGTDCTYDFGGDVGVKTIYQSQTAGTCNTPFQHS